MRDFIEDNRKHWEELAALHPETDHYDVDGFLDGTSTLDPITWDGAESSETTLHATHGQELGAPVTYVGRRAARPRFRSGC